MKQIFLLLLLALFPGQSWALFVEGCPDGANCMDSEKVWVQIDPFGAHLDPEVVALVVGGGLLLWGIGCGIGMYLQSVRKLRM